MKIYGIEVDPENTDPEYWEKILSDTGDSMSRGSLRDDPNQRKALREMYDGGHLGEFFGTTQPVLDVVEDGMEVIDVNNE